MIKLAFVFPGQGSQFVGMSKSLFDHYELARRTYEEAGEALGYDIAHMSFDGSLLDLNKPENMFPAILVSGVASYRVFMHDFGITPQMCAGHSLGEYTALTCSGAIRFWDAVQIVHKRGKFAQEIADLDTGSMTIIDNIDSKLIEEECAKVSEMGYEVSISCYNSPRQAAICGLNQGVTRVEDKVMMLGGQISPLIGGAPFHCSLMQKAADKLETELLKYKFGYTRYPVISNVTGLPISDSGDMASTLVKQLTHPVKWDSIINYMQKRGITHTIEMGPKNVLTNIIKSNSDNIDCLCFGLKEDRHALEELIFTEGKLEKHIPTVLTKCLAAAVATPNLNWNENEFHEGVVQPYRRMQEMQEMHDKDMTKPSLEQVEEALGLLQTIFDTKKLPKEEQSEWYEQILDETGMRYAVEIPGN